MRSLLVVIGIALGVALYVATEAATASMSTAFSEFVTRVSGRADLTIQGQGPGVPNELVADVAEVPGVEHAAANLELTVQAPDFKESLLVLGVDLLGDLHFLPFVVTEGEQRVIEDPLAFVNDPTAILVSQKFAARHHLTKGSHLKLLTSDGPKEFNVRGVLDDKGPAASFGGQVAVMFLDAAQVSFAKGTFVDRIDVAVSPGESPQAVRNRLRGKIGGAFRVEYPEQIGVRLRSLTDPLRGGLWLSGIFALIVGGFLVYNAVSISVAQRRREIGVLRALGATRRGVTALFSTEAALLSLPGVLLGLVLGSFLSQYSTEKTQQALNNVYTAIPRVEPHLTVAIATRAALAGILTAVVAAWWPARRGASLDPAIVLRGASSVERSRIPAIGLSILGVGVVLLAWLPYLRGKAFGELSAIFLTIIGSALTAPLVIIALRRALVRVVESIGGIPARLGLDYVQRTLARSTVNVLALMVAVSMSVAVGGWLTSLERSITRWADQMTAADLSVTQGSPLLDRRHVPLSAAAADRVAHVPGVERTQRFRIIEQEVNGTSIRVEATDTDAVDWATEHRRPMWVITSGEPLRPGELVNQKRLVLSENAARRLHVDVGDSLLFNTPKGPVKFEVRAIVLDYSSETGIAFLDRHQFLEQWGDDAVDSLFVYMAPGAREDVVADGIRAALGGQASIFVTTTTAVRGQIIESLRDTFSYSRAVEIVTLLIALMGVIGTMVAAVIDRARDIGMLRAIGATSRQVAASIVVEAGFLGVCAVIIGLAAGLIETQLFLQTLFSATTGWHLDFVFPWAAASRIGGLVIAASALAGGLPAWRAARADISSAVVCE